MRMLVVLLAALLLAPTAWAIPAFHEAPPPERVLSEMPALSDLRCVDGMAGDFHCHGVDLAAFMPLGDMGCTSTGNDVWGWTDPETGREYALMGCNNGISFVDVTFPVAPVYIGRLPTQTVSSLWRDAKVYADHAFVVSEASGHGLQVFDLSALRAVTDPPVTFSPSAHDNSFGRAHNIEINAATGYAYVVGSNRCNGGLHIIDISDPINPQVAGCFGADGYTHDVQCVIYHGPDTNYQGSEICFAANENTLTIVDVTDKSNPQMLARETYPGVGYTHQGWLTEDHAYFLLDDELDEINFGHNTKTRIWDVGNLHEPVIIGIYESAEDATDHNLYIKGNFCYQANYSAGLRILDLENVADGELVEVAYFDVIPHGFHVRHDGPGFFGAWSNFPFFDSGTVLVSTIGLEGEPAGLFVTRPRLDESAIQGTVTDALTGLPLEGADIEIVAGLPHSASTAGDGNYQIGILPGIYTVIATHSEYQAVSVSGVEVVEGEPTVVDLALEPLLQWVLAPELLDFGPHEVGTVSSPLNAVLTNTGQIEIRIEEITIPAAPFFRKTDDDCGEATFVLEPETSCEMSFAFAPEQPLAFASQLEIITAEAGQRTLEFTGEGVAPEIAFSVPAVHFGVVAVGEMAVSEQLTLTNIGQADLVITSLNLTGDDIFAITNEECSGLLLEPQQSCVFGLRFEPIEEGVFDGILTVTSNTPDGEATLAMRGATVLVFRDRLEPPGQ